MDHIHLRSLIFDRPHMIARLKLDDVLAVLSSRLDLEGAPEDTTTKAIAHTPLEAPPGLGVVSIGGTLVNRFMTAPSGATSYDRIRAALYRLERSNAVRAIVLDVESFGGEAAGCMDLSAEIRALDAIKPVYGIINAHACSAGYALACAARKVFMVPDGIAGSIGVIAVHADQSKHDEKKGISYSILHKGERKADFSPHAPLSDKARELLDSMLEESYQSFVSLVARHRGLSEDAVRATNAALFKGRTALKAGLVDEIATAGNALTSILKEVNSMGQKNQHDQPRADSEKISADTPETADVEAAVEEQIAKAKATARAEAAVAERERIAKIREACQIAKVGQDFEAQLIEKGVPLDAARAKIFETMAANQVDIDPGHADVPAVPAAESWSTIMARVNKQRGVKRHA